MKDPIDPKDFDGLATSGSFEKGNMWVVPYGNGVNEKKLTQYSYQDSDGYWHNFELINDEWVELGCTRSG